MIHVCELIECLVWRFVQGSHEYLGTMEANTEEIIISYLLYLYIPWGSKLCYVKFLIECSCILGRNEYAILHLLNGGTDIIITTETTYEGTHTMIVDNTTEFTRVTLDFVLYILLVCLACIRYFPAFILLKSIMFQFLHLRHVADAHVLLLHCNIQALLQNNVSLVLL